MAAGETALSNVQPLRQEQSERELRVQLAAAYRIFHHFGWPELIYGHITVRVPGPEHHFLINPFGLMYHEMTASNLVKIDLDGNIVEPSNYPVNPAGFVIHSAVHRSREDAQCVMHTHTTAGMAVAAMECGLRPVSFPAIMLHGRVAYHDFEGVSTRLDERERLVESLGDKKVMILRNHGLLSVGKTVAEAFAWLYTLERACQVQVAAMQSGTPLIEPTEEVQVQHASGIDEVNAEVGFGTRDFAALMRLMDEKDPSYRN